MSDANEIACRLLDEPCPHFGSIPRANFSMRDGPRKRSCDLCLVAVLREYGDERAREEREACANLAQERAHELAAAVACERDNADALGLESSLTNEAAIARQIEAMIHARTP